MGLSLRNLGRKLWDQVNIADGGKTFNSNRAPIITRSAPVARPQPRPQPVRRPQQSRGFFSAVGNAASSNRYTRPIANYGATLAKNTFTPEQIKTYDENAFEGLKAITAEVASPTNIARANPMLLPSQLRQAATNKLGIKTPTSQSVVDAGIKKFNESRVGKNKVSGFVGNNFVAPIAKSFARASDVGSGASRYDKGLKGFGQYGTDTFNVASMAYTPIKAGVLAKGGVPALKAVPGSLARGGAAGVGINVVDQLGRGVKPKDINIKETALTGLIGGGANLIPGAAGFVARGAKAVAPKIGKAVAKTASAGSLNNVAHRNLATNNPTYKRLQSQLELSTNAARNAERAGASGQVVKQHLDDINYIQSQMSQMRTQATRSGAVSLGGNASELPKGKKLPTDTDIQAQIASHKGGLGKIEKTTTNMSDAERLRLAKGDPGQAGIGSDPTALAQARARMQADIQAQKPKATLKKLDESGGGRLPIVDKLDEKINKPKVTPKDPLESLKQEARKYKSAEEFVNSQANLLHGTKADFTEFDPSLLGTNTGAPSAKKGFFFTDTPEIANHYANPGRNYGTAISKNLDDAFNRITSRAKAEGLDNSLSNNNGAAMIVGSWPKVSPGASKESVIKAVIDKIDNLKTRFDSPEDIAKIERYKKITLEELANTPITELEMFGRVMKSKVDFKNPLEIDDNGFRNGASYAQRIDEAIAKGHDGVIIKNTQDPLRGNIYVALNKNQILTEKQLTDLYNQSQPPKSTPNKPKVGSPEYRQALIDEKNALQAKGKVSYDGAGDSVLTLDSKTKARVDAIDKELVAIADSKPRVRAKQAEPSEVKPVVRTNEIRTKASDGVDIDNEIQKAILGDTSAPTYKVGAGGKLAEKLSVNKQLRRATQPVEGVVNKGIRASLESGSRVGRTPGSIVEGLSRQAGRTPQELERLAQFGGQKQYGDVLAKKLATEGEDAVKTGVRKDVIASALDPELAKARGVKPTKLSAIEQAEVDKLRKIIDLTHEGEYKIGLLDEKRYIANKGKYFPRDFTKFFESDAGRQIAKKNKLDLNIFKGRKELGDIPKEVLDAAETDPYFMTALRVQQYTKNKAIMDYTDFISKGKSISDTPRKGYVAVPDSPAYGAIKGKYVLKEQLEDLEGFIYETDVAKNVVALLNAYDRNPIRQGLKATKTVYNPGVRLGNRTFNYLTSSLNGVNPITFTKNYARGRKMIKAGSPEYLEATKAGIFGSSIVDKELYRTKDLLEPKSKNVLKRGHEAASSSYGKVDDEGKMAMYLSFRDRGVSVEEAAKRTRRAMQNYDMVGKYFDLGAKTPVGGSAFVRFSSELMRIAQNSAIDNPLRMAGAMAAVVGITTLASQLSGETPEDRKTREERVGAPRVPFTNQSLEIQTPWGAVNIGRLLGVTTYNDLVGGMQEDAKRLLPFQSPVTNSPDGLKFNPNFVTSDPMIGPLVGQLIDKDFRGKSISDPDKEKYPNQPLSTGEQLKNRLKTAAMAYIPLSNEFDSLNSARKGEENFYGKKRSLTQAALRTAGIKVEKYGPEEAKAQRGKNEYFEGEYARAKDFLKQNPDLKEAYNKFKGREKDRTTGKNYYDIVTPEKWSIIKSDNSGRLYDFLRGEAEKSNKKDGKPVDPVFKLPTKEQQSIVTELRSRPTGEDIETEEILRATQSWYNSFEKAERDYYEANTAYYKDKKIPDTAGERSKAYINVKYPEQPAGVKEYYKLKTDNPDAAKELFKTTNLSDQFDAYAKERLKYINAKRKIEGFPPISETTFDNVTFGFEEDERKVYNELKYGKGYGGYGSRGGRRGGGGGGRGSNPNDNPDKYRISLGAGGSASVANTIKKPKVVAKAPTSPLLNYGKGKASLKKSKV